MLNASNLNVRILLGEHGRSFAPQPRGSCFFQHTYRQARYCSSQHLVGQGNLADQEADQEAERDGHEHRDAPFEQRIERHHVEGIGKTDQHRGMDQVDRIDTGG